MRILLGVVLVAVIAAGFMAWHNSNQQQITSLMPAAGDVMASDATATPALPTAEEIAPQGIAVGEPNPSTPPSEPVVTQTPDGPVASPALPMQPNCGTHDDLVGKNLKDIDMNNLGPDVKSTRVVHPGEVMTMEYMFNRLTIEVDGSDVVVKATCG